MDESKEKSGQFGGLKILYVLFLLDKWNFHWLNESGENFSFCKKLKDKKCEFIYINGAFFKF